MNPEKYLLTIEFRYEDAPKYEEGGFEYINKIVTIGVYESFDDACINGNSLLEILESKFSIHTFPDGREAKKERFSKNGGCFGSKNTLVTDMAYLKTPFRFFAKIDTLKYSSISESIEDALSATKRRKAYNSIN